MGAHFYAAEYAHNPIRNAVHRVFYKRFAEGKRVFCKIGQRRNVNFFETGKGAFFAVDVKTVGTIACALFKIVDSTAVRAEIAGA